MILFAPQIEPIAKNVSTDIWYWKLLRATRSLCRNFNGTNWRRLLWRILGWLKEKVKKIKKKEGHLQKHGWTLFSCVFLIDRKNSTSSIVVNTWRKNYIHLPQKSPCILFYLFFISLKSFISFNEGLLWSAVDWDHLKLSLQQSEQDCPCLK